MGTDIQVIDTSILDSVADDLENKAADDTDKVAGIDDKAADDKAADDKKVADDKAKTDEDKVDDKGLDKLSALEEQNNSLKQLLREQKKQMALLSARVGRGEATTKAKGDGVTNILDEDEDEEKKEQPLSAIEQLQNEIVMIGQVKGPVLETLLETMELNPNFTDVKEVCSRTNLDDVIEVIASEISVENNADPVETALAIEAKIWAKPNPYKFMYDLIKKNHPKYAKPPEKKADEKSKDEDKPKDEKKPTEEKKAPGTIVKVPGTDEKSSGWTAARIDAMDESELTKVPKDVYEKYLRGELD